MPIKVMNIVEYNTTEARTALMVSVGTMNKLIRTGEIPHRVESSGAYKIAKDDLIDYAIKRDKLPPDVAERVIEYRISNIRK